MFIFVIPKSNKKLNIELIPSVSSHMLFNISISTKNFSRSICKYKLYINKPRLINDISVVPKNIIKYICTLIFWCNRSNYFYCP